MKVRAGRPAARSTSCRTGHHRGVAHVSTVLCFSGFFFCSECRGVRKDVNVFWLRTATLPSSPVTSRALLREAEGPDAHPNRFVQVRAQAPTLVEPLACLPRGCALGISGLRAAVFQKNSERRRKRVQTVIWQEMGRNRRGKTRKM